MIVVFKNAPPQKFGPGAALNPCAGDPMAAVEMGCGYLVWWITIINYNLKAGRCVGLP
jgi:hypothetical protein